MVKFLPHSGHLLSITANRRIRFWDLLAIDTLDVIPDKDSVILDLPQEDLSQFEDIVNLMQLGLKKSSFDVSSDGRQVAAAIGHNVVVWDSTTGVIIHRLYVHTDYVLAVAFSPTGDLIACSSGIKMIRLWNVFKGTWRKQSTHNGTGIALCLPTFSPDGTRLALALQRNIIIWNMETGNMVRIDPSFGNTMTMNFCLNGRIFVSSCEWGYIRAWDTKDGTLLAESQNPIFTGAATLSSDCKLFASVSWDGTVHMRDVVQMMEPYSNSLLRRTASSDSILYFEMFPKSSQLVAVTDGDTIRVLDVEAGMVLKTLNTPQPKKAWTWERLRDFMLLQTPERRVVTAFSSDSKYFASSNGNKIAIWETNGWTMLRELKAHDRGVAALLFLQDDEVLVSTDGACLRSWSTDTGEEFKSERQHLDPGDEYCSSISRDGRYLANWTEEFLMLWDITARKCIHHISFEDIKRVEFSVDGKCAVTMQKLDEVLATKFNFWDITTGENLRTLYAKGWIHRFSLSKYNSYIETEKQRILIPQEDSNKEAACSHHDLGVIDNWVTHGNKRILWLPYEVRPKCVAVHGDKIIFGYFSGSISIFDFDLELLRGLEDGLDLELEPDYLSLTQPE